MSYIDETRMLQNFNVKVNSFSSAKTNDMFRYLVLLPEKNPDYVILHVGTNNAANHQSNNIISRIFKRIHPVRGTSCKVIISTPIKR